ncbi:MAG: saccharopine dehydrogenase NADP-binding domain-containing protein [Anaerolineae bacterium]|nr:saccharopine dehydrogenase NADP-binding domain-containing protein [Anaerolineae bacterium]
MKILILGSGLMGPAAAFNAMNEPEVEQVLIGDASPAQLDTAVRKLAGKPGVEKLRPIPLDLNDGGVASELIGACDAVVAALPRSASILGIRAALQAGVPLVDLTWPAEEHMPGLRQEVEAARGLIIPGCGVEPGLTEIMARHLAEQLDRVDELHIKCGGIPEIPAPPLGYKIVFGGQQLPLREQDGPTVEAGRLKLVPRYSGVEAVTFPGVGELEAWHETFMPWLLDLPVFKNLQTGTQKTVRWPGFAAKATLLKELGLLSLEPVEVEGVKVAPKKLLDALLYPQVALKEGERDITVLRVEVKGEKDGQPYTYKVEMVDRYDETTGFTSMARTTAFTGAIITRMVARGEIPERGLLTPEQVITGPRFERLVGELAAAKVSFTLTTERVETSA